MIISASRRTDIPAFYGEWMYQRLQEGRVHVPNPYRPHQVREILFSPESIDCIVFWTKNLLPFLSYLPEISRMGYSFYFQHTLTPYGTDLEPGIAEKRKILDGMRRFGEHYGSDALVWRYDPILLNSEWKISRHIDAFGQLCRAMQETVGRCVISFLDLYPGRMKTRSFREITPEEMEILAREFGKIAAEYRIPLYTCAEAGDYTAYGIQHSSCIDPELAEKAAGYPLKLTADRYQRTGCGCAESLDIGMYGSCPHGCRYCYASGGRRLVSEIHDPNSPRLLGYPDKEDSVQKVLTVSDKKEQLCLF
ncbi:MAG: DUF1848 domain-containing protein [Candidatus Merdivicinus sp.]|jgi:hypothetical protein